MGSAETTTGQTGVREQSPTPKELKVPIPPANEVKKWHVNTLSLLPAEASVFKHAQKFLHQTYRLDIEGMTCNHILDCSPDYPEDKYHYKVWITVPTGHDAGSFMHIVNVSKPRRRRAQDKT